MNPIDNPDAYDVITLAGQVSPGIAEVSSAKRQYEWDIKKPKGSSGGSMTFQGEALSAFKVKFKLWLPEHFAAWAGFRLLLEKSPAAKEPTALTIQHPDLDELGIRDVTVLEIGGRVHEGKGLHSYIVDFSKYAEAKKAGGTPKGSKAAGAQGSTQDAADAEIQRLLDKARAA